MRATSAWPFQPSAASASRAGGLEASDPEIATESEEKTESSPRLPPRWPYQFADLAVGGTAYAWVAGSAYVDAEERDASDVLVCCHGINWFSDMSFGALADPLLSALNRAGGDEVTSGKGGNNDNVGQPRAKWRILVFDFIGRGRSAAPAGAVFSPDLFVTQLQQLLDYLELARVPRKEERAAPKARRGGDGGETEGSRVHLLGLSLGGAVATHFASKFPERVASLVLLAPAIVPVGVPLGGRVLALPWIGPFVARNFLAGLLLQKLRTERFSEDFVSPLDRPALVDEFVRRVEWMIESKEGFVEAFQSTLQHFHLGAGQHAAVKLAAASKIQTLIVYGTHDKLFPLARARAFCDAYWPSAQFACIEDAGHALTVEAVSEVVDLVEAFCRRISSQSAGSAVAKRSDDESVSAEVSNDA